jgi:hypothetical protein
MSRHFHTSLYILFVIIELTLGYIYLHYLIPQPATLASVKRSAEIEIVPGVDRISLEDSMRPKQSSQWPVTMPTYKRGVEYDITPSSSDTNLQYSSV